MFFPRQIKPQRFQSTLPSRGATPDGKTKKADKVISIHAPLAGSDGGSGNISGIIQDFNPRSPRGERPRKPIWDKLYSTISIHAPLAGSDDSNMLQSGNQL